MPKQMDLFGSAPTDAEPDDTVPIITVPIIDGLWAPPDVEAAHRPWGANCGPCALAALIGRTVNLVRRAFPWFPERAYTTASQMVEAAERLEFKATLRTDWQGIAYIGPPVALPPAALLQVQWTGPWTAPGASPRWAYKHTHFVAALHGGAALYDVNLGAWTRAEYWMKLVAPVLARDVPRADGGWWIRSVVEVDPLWMPARGVRRGAWLETHDEDVPQLHPPRRALPVQPAAHDAGGGGHVPAPARRARRRGGRAPLRPCAPATRAATPRRGAGGAPMSRERAPDFIFVGVLLHNPEKLPALPADGKSTYLTLASMQCGPAVIEHMRVDDRLTGFIERVWPGATWRRASLCDDAVALVRDGDTMRPVAVIAGRFETNAPGGVG